MSEHADKKSLDTFDSVSFGPITLTYNSELLGGTANYSLGETETMLAMPHFSTGTNKHIKGGDFSLKRFANDTSAALGHITYNATEGSANRIYGGFNSILRELSAHLESQAFFCNFDLSFNGGTLMATSQLQTFYFRVESSPVNAFEITLTTGAQYDSSQPSSQDILEAASAWAHVCEYVVRLGAGKHEAIPPEANTIIVLGELKEYPSDIEIALTQELEDRRKTLGKAATLPHFDDTDILSLDTQALISNNDISLDELPLVAKNIVDKKRAEYATLEIMTAITQSDIVNALKEVVKNRV